MQQTITSKHFGTTPKGEFITEFTLTNAKGNFVKIIDFGGIVTEVQVPDRNGERNNVVLGFDTLEPYLKKSPYIGALIGRYGNRIANGRFSLEGVNYELATNNPPNNLHGGWEGFDKKVWQAEPFENTLGPGLHLCLLSEDGDQGFPGNLNVKVTYQWTHDNQLVVDYFATTDKTTLVNLTQHTYFNLAGKGSVLNHQLQLFADHFTAVSESLIPIGELTPVANTPFDFRLPHAIGERIDADHEQILRGFGYDHNFVINQPYYKALTLAARVYEPISGRTLEVITQEPGVQFYSANFLDGSLIGKSGPCEKRHAFCLEPQHYPDSPNQPQFPSTVLRPSEQYKTKTIFMFSIQ
jgi:aldose 1-epimerase